MTLSDRFKSFSSSTQVVLVLLCVAVIGGALGGVYLQFFQTHYAVLFTDVRSSDAATIIAELEKTKTPYQLADGGKTVLVPAEVVDKTRIDLMSGPLPLKGTVGFELFNKTDMGVTEFAQKINYQRALQGELERTIKSMDGVDDARVHLALAEPTIFRDDQKPPKASVTLFMHPGRPLLGNIVRGVQRLIAAAVPDLDVANVVVLDERGAIVSDAADQESSLPVAIPAPGSSLSAIATAPRPSLTARTPSTSAAPRTPASAAISDPIILGAGAIALLALAGIVGLVMALSRPSSRLTAAKRAAYVRRLKALLESQELNGFS